MTYPHRAPMLFPTPTDPLAAHGPLVARRTPEFFDNRPYECFSLAPVTPTIGAEISGIRLGGDLPDETMRVVRVSNRTPSDSSRLRTVWLSDEGERPSFTAAFEKPRSRATARKTSTSLIRSRAIAASRSQVHADYAV